MDRVQKTPSTITERWDERVEGVAKGLYESRRKLLDAVGTAPYRGKPASEQQMQDDYRQVRDDVEGWKGVLGDAVKTTADGRVLIRKDFLEGMRKQESKFRVGDAKKMLDEVMNDAYA